MKKIYFTFLCLITSSFVFAQGNINKGDWLLGGDIDFSSSKWKTISDKTTSFSFAPAFGHFFANQLLGAVSVNLSSSKSGSGNNEYKSTSTSFTPFIRYYFLPSTNDVNLFASAGYSFGSWEDKLGSTTTSDGNYNGIELRGGVSAFVIPSVAINFSLAYNTENYKDNDDYNGFNVSIGFNIHLPGSRSNIKNTTTGR